MKRVAILSGTSHTAASAIACVLCIIGFCAALVVAIRAAQSADTVKGKLETYQYLVFSNPVDGQETEYNRWYDNQHAPDVVAVPGFVTAQRFVAADTQLRDSKLPAKYLVVYKVVTDDL